MALVRPDTENVVPRFLHYYFLSSRWRSVVESNVISGATVDRIPLTRFPDFEIQIPEISTQRSIASILSAYDDLIENNRRRIQLLEQAARLLYKEWFVHLRFPGHEHISITDGVPEGWELKPLGEMAPLKYGKALKKDNRVPGPFPVYGSSGIVGTHEKALVTGPAIIVGRKGNVGHSRTLLVPDDKILAPFEQDVTVIHNQIDQLTKYNEALTQARDLLLPRLMNGEVAV
jgi:type I restriction enzyme S subunit